MARGYQACAILAIVLMIPCLALADVLETFRAQADNRPMIRESLGFRSARALSADQVELLIGMSITNAAGQASSYRIISFDDPAYAYEKFVMPKSAKAQHELEVRGVAGCPFEKFERTRVVLTLPFAMKDGATYHIVAQGTNGLMVTGAHTAQSFVYKPAPQAEKTGESIHLAVLGLRQIESVGHGVVRLEFGPDFSPDAGGKLENYHVTLNDKPVTPTNLGRITRIDTYLPVGWPFQAIAMHDIFLQLPLPLGSGDRIEVSLDPSITTAANTAALAYDDLKSLSASIKVNQVGYITDSLAKTAYVGRWMGSFPQVHSAPAAGAANAEEAFFAAVQGKKEPPITAANPSLLFPAPPSFAIYNEQTGQKVFEGKSTLIHTSGNTDEGVYKCDHSGENVYRLDFAGLKEPGRYFISIPGVGRSLPFEVAPDVYRKAFEVQSYGVFAQRCGIELAPPYSDWHRIACHIKGITPTTQEHLEKHEITELAHKVDEARLRQANGPIHAFGGHHDAGDYNPRSHYEVAQTLMDAYEIAPRKFYDGQLNIPENHNDIPDILDEAHWAMQLWMGLQDADGGVFNGTESDGDPNLIQTVELDPRGDFAYAKDAVGSFTFAGFMAQASRIWKGLGRDKEASDFLGRSRRAYEWAIKHPPRQGQDAALYARAWLNPKAYAAAELLGTTGEKRFDEDFRASCVWSKNPAAELAVYNLYDQSRAAWAYANCPPDRADAQLQKACRNAILRQADQYIQLSSKMAYAFVREPWSPISWGTGAYENGLTSTLWSWKLTGDEKYRTWMIRTCDNTLGANPLGLSYITGLGTRPIHAPLHNSRYSHLGEVVPGQQCEGPSQRPDGYRVAESSFPRPREDFAPLYTFTDSHFAIPLDEGLVITQAKTMATFGLLLPDHIPQAAR
jgi:endoglucanase